MDARDSPKRLRMMFLYCILNPVRATPPFLRGTRSCSRALSRSVCSLPSGLQRTPGPKAILYYLPRDPELQKQTVRLPRSTSTVWKLLYQLGLLASKPARKHQPEPLHDPLEEIQVDAQRREYGSS